MLLEVRELELCYRLRAGRVRAVDRVSFTLDEGRSLGLVGESGCGKTSLARALLRLLPPTGEIAGGQILFQGRDLVGLPEAEMRQVRWKEVALVPQSAMNALDPVYRVSAQIIEAIRTHERRPRRQALARARQLFERLGLDGKRLSDFPHQLSGGMKQRATIAMALALNPRLLIADEPTTALDVIVQDHILRELKSLQAELGLALLFISHDISVISETCEAVGVMYAGRLVEYGRAADVFTRPHHPYTMGLYNAFPSLEEDRPPVSIPGFPPTLLHIPPGCRFAPRCPFAQPRCDAEDPTPREAVPGHWVACHRAGEAETLRLLARDPTVWQQTRAAQQIAELPEGGEPPPVGERVGEVLGGIG
ncbi:MAG: ABC transporter ATP-binding protein [Deltaproteobacteria bacterium]|nr:ABC transporter ATP-binding protein [Deltaproteobacteria bacterium]